MQVVGPQIAAPGERAWRCRRGRPGGRGLRSRRSAGGRSGDVTQRDIRRRRVWLLVRLGGVRRAGQEGLVSTQAMGAPHSGCLQRAPRTGERLGGWWAERWRGRTLQDLGSRRARSQQRGALRGLGGPADRGAAEGSGGRAEGRRPQRRTRIRGGWLVAGLVFGRLVRPIEIGPVEEGPGWWYEPTALARRRERRRVDEGRRGGLAAAEVYAGVKRPAEEGRRTRQWLAKPWCAGRLWCVRSARGRLRPTASPQRWRPQRRTRIRGGWLVADLVFGPLVRPIEIGPVEEGPGWWYEPTALARRRERRRVDEGRRGGLAAAEVYAGVKRPAEEGRRTRQWLAKPWCAGRLWCVRGPWGGARGRLSPTASP